MLINLPNLSPKVIATITLAGVLSACGSSGAETSRQNPNFFSGRVEEATMNISGVCNPSGYSEAEMRSFLALICLDVILESYGQLPEEDLVRFTASCEGGYISGARVVEFERVISGTTLLDIPDKIVVEVTGDDGRGNLVYDRREVAL